jgi:hypothetical protein
MLFLNMKSWPRPATAGSVNQTPWRSYAANQVLFLGCSGNSEPAGLVNVTFHFEVGINASQLSVAGTQVPKNAHDYLWCSYEEAVDTGALRKYNKPTYVWVSTVYPNTDFGQLGIN